MPPACHTKPVLVKTKPDARPRLCPEPVWGHGAKQAILTEWAEEKIKSGEFEHYPESEQASRPHKVEKRKQGSPKDSDNYDIRVCGDYVCVNSQCMRLQANAPNTKYLLKKAAGKHAYWYIDMDK